MYEKHSNEKISMAPAEGWHAKSWGVCSTFFKKCKVLALEEAHKWTKLEELIKEIKNNKYFYYERFGLYKLLVAMRWDSFI